MHSKGRVGDVVQATTPTHVSSMIDFVSGASATLVTSFDVKATRFKNIEVYGTEGTLSLPDPNTFGGPLKVRSIIADDWREISVADPEHPAAARHRAGGHAVGHDTRIVRIVHRPNWRCTFSS